MTFLLRLLLRFREKTSRRHDLPPSPVGAIDDGGSAITPVSSHPALVPPPPNAEEEGESKPFLEHLEDLRWMLIKMAIALSLAMTFGLVFRKELMHFCQGPLRNLPDKFGSGLQSLGVADSFTVSMQLAFYGGLVIAFPFLLYFLAQFVLPALTKAEKKVLWPALAVGFGLFLAGATLAFAWLLPQALVWLAHDAQEMGMRSSWTVRDYFSFVTQFTIGLGLAFELPVVVIVLVKLGILSYGTLRKTRSYALIIILFLAAIISPTPDLFTWGMMSAPLLLLYESCIWIAWWMERSAKKAA